VFMLVRAGITPLRLIAARMLHNCANTPQNHAVLWGNLWGKPWRTRRRALPFTVLGGTCVVVAAVCQVR
jgi:hypothetical protein